MPTRLWRCLLILALALATPALALDRDVLLDQANILLLPRERAIPPLELVDQDGQRFDTRSLQGRWHILFFGFTACPDICPTTLSDMRRLFSQLPKETRNQLQLVLITADPARDTPQQLKTYLDYYRGGFNGLTGDMEQLQRLSRALGLPFVPASETQGDYSVSHSGNLALVGPDGTLRGHIRAPLQLEGLRRMLPQIVDTER
ncbi:SCO family protein [Stutzerimonas stutzeri]|uniref:SCO family protein n=1 Tax=Stutzerimonas stutzeri TaxID=316 RepID=A0A4S2BJU4_STUST|nr:SCO family protein [Stutzerimonas stutzeri]OHC18472.1 MAG: cytochrome c oxidase assembly protein [Pseudomonadales bacterium RIFCSPHIGHO2_01_FULL_64_12]MDH1238117.1 SCO family protein [Stutzerimonas stutzeri]MDH1541391.1 SCO family protein [Stutzerimonas stutzeri]MDH1671225.1 SCO family protein [Stutzerimonas stutzeri]RAA01234.1 SCO family protein [Stutzerimonas stutzeri]